MKQQETRENTGFEQTDPDEIRHIIDVVAQGNQLQMAHKLGINPPMLRAWIKNTDDRKTPARASVIALRAFFWVANNLTEKQQKKFFESVLKRVDK